MESDQQPNQPTEPSVPSAPKKSSVSLPAAIVTAAAIIGIALVVAFGPGKAPKTSGVPSTSEQPTSVPAEIAKVRPGEYLRGNADATVVIIEYSDSDCPYCARFHDTMQETLDTYGDDVAWVYRFFPLTTLHPNAYDEALALACVGELGGNDKFWSYMDTVINVTLTADAKASDTLATFAGSIGIDSALFKKCLSSQSLKAVVDADIEEAKKIGARGTPFSIAVNQVTGKQAIIPGAVPTEYLIQTIDSLLQ